MGGDDGSGGAPDGGVGGEPTAGAGGSEVGGEGGAPVVGAGGEGGAPGPEWDVVQNPGFEQTNSDNEPPLHWTVTGDTAAVTYSWSNSGAHWEDTTPDVGDGYLDLWLGSDYTVDVSQVVSPIPDGSYTLSILHYGGAYTSQVVYVTGYDEANPTAETTAPTAESAGDVFDEIRIENIPVTSGTITIGIRSVGAANNWSHFDDVSLTLSTE